jgi:hypothetical protein
MDLIAPRTSAEQRATIAMPRREIVKMPQSVRSDALAFGQIVANLKTAVETNVTAHEVADALTSLESGEAIFFTMEDGRPIRAALLRCAPH